MTRTSTGKKPKTCTTEGCRRRKPKNRTICNHCRHEREKLKDPEKYTYQTWKRNAKRRGKEFTITLEQFRQFCIKTEYMTGKGRMKESLHIDRIIESKGYVKGNIRALENGKNIRKYMMYAYGPKGKPQDFKVSISRPMEDSDDYPF